MRYEIRAMSVGEILDTGFQLLRNHFRLLFGLGLLIALPFEIQTLIATSLTDEASGSNPPVLVNLVMTTVMMMVSAITWAAITTAIGKIYVGEEISWQSALRTALSIATPLIRTTVVVALAVVLLGLATVLLVVLPATLLGAVASLLGAPIGRLAWILASPIGVGVWLYMLPSFLLVQPVMALERVFGVDTLRRSHALVSDHRRRALAVQFVAFGVAGALGFAVHSAFKAQPLLAAIAGIATQPLLTSYAGIIQILLYFDLRCRKEAFDLEHLAALVHSNAMQPAAIEGAGAPDGGAA